MKDNFILGYFVGGILACIAIYFFIVKPSQEKLSQYEQQSKIFQSQLQQSVRERDILANRIDSILTVNSNISQLILEKEKELKSIKGRYKNKSTVELGELMEERANGR